MGHVMSAPSASPVVKMAQVGDVLAVEAVANGFRVAAAGWHRDPGRAVSSDEIFVFPAASPELAHHIAAWSGADRLGPVPVSDTVPVPVDMSPVPSCSSGHDRTTYFVKLGELRRARVGTLVISVTGESEHIIALDADGARRLAAQLLAAAAGR